MQAQFDKNIVHIFFIDLAFIASVSNNLFSLRLSRVPTQGYNEAYEMFTKRHVNISREIAKILFELIDIILEDGIYFRLVPLILRHKNKLLEICSAQNGVHFLKMTRSIYIVQKECTAFQYFYERCTGCCMTLSLAYVCLSGNLKLTPVLTLSRQW